MWWVVLVLLFPTTAWADRVCVVKSTGKLIEYQSDAKEGTLLQNALNTGYKEKDIEEEK